MNTDYDYAESQWLSDFTYERERLPTDSEYDKFYAIWWKECKDRLAADAAVEQWENRDE